MAKKIAHKTKYRITQDEVDLIKKKAECANKLINSKVFSEYRDFFKQAKGSIESQILNNTVVDVTEQKTFGETIKSFFTPKKVQIDEMAGMYKFMTQRDSVLQSWIDDKVTLDNQLKDESVQVVSA